MSDTPGPPPRDPQSHVGTSPSTARPGDPVTAPDLEKIHVVLVDDPEGLTGESMWAEPLGDGHYKIANIPFHVDHLNYGDVVLCDESDPDQIPEVVTVVTPGNGLTLRVTLAEDELDDDVATARWRAIRPRLRAAGVAYSEGLGGGAYVVHVAAGHVAAAISTIRRLEYDEAIWSWETNHPGVDEP
jgi:hypothetical protein